MTRKGQDRLPALTFGTSRLDTFLAAHYVNTRFDELEKSVISKQLKD